MQLFCNELSDCCLQGKFFTRDSPACWVYLLFFTSSGLGRLFCFSSETVYQAVNPLLRLVGPLDRELAGCWIRADARQHSEGKEKTEIHALTWIRTHAPCLLVFQELFRLIC
jgi:hypothetical protein